MRFYFQRVVSWNLPSSHPQNLFSDKRVTSFHREDDLTIERVRKKVERIPNPIPIVKTCHCLYLNRVNFFVDHPWLSDAERISINWKIRYGIVADYRLPVAIQFSHVRISWCCIVHMGSPSDWRPVYVCFGFNYEREWLLLCHCAIEGNRKGSRFVPGKVFRELNNSSGCRFPDDLYVNTVRCLWFFKNTFNSNGACDGSADFHWRAQYKLLLRTEAIKFVSVCIG